MQKTLTQIVFALLCVGVMGYTGFHNWMLLNAFSSPVWAWVGLALFEGGCVAWLMFFLNVARGDVQRTWSSATSAVDLGLCITCAILHLFLSNRLSSAPGWVSDAIPWIVGIAVLVNGVAVWVCKLNAPDAVEKRDAQDLEDEIFKKAQIQAREDLKQHSPYLASVIVRHRLDNLTRRIESNHGAFPQPETQPVTHNRLNANVNGQEVFTQPPTE